MGKTLFSNPADDLRIISKRTSIDFARARACARTRADGGEKLTKFRDGFARDSLLQQRVTSELSGTVTRGDLLCLQIIRNYLECCKESGPSHRRHQGWFFSNWDNPEFRAEWENRFSRSEPERTAESIGVKLARERERQCAFERRAAPL